ncbi:MAG: beta-lactamase family protein [Rhodothermales bacterium]|nr:beta-lactamase family protein [Rhodothermales bacterium]MBO6778590.1 beta-lactamase family protein [Rhodothermales bacterium]
MRLRYCLPLLAATMLAAPSTAQQGPSPEIRALIDALVETLNSSHDEAIPLFVVQHVHPDYVAERGNEGIEAELREMRSAVSGANDLGVDRTESGLRLMFRGAGRTARVMVAIPFESPNLITGLGLDVSGGGRADVAQEPTSASEAIGVRLRGLEGVWETGSADGFISEHVDPNAVDADMLEALEHARIIGSRAGGIMVGQEGGVGLLKLRGPGVGGDFRLWVQEGAPYKVTRLEFDAVSETEGEEPAAPSFDWETVEQALEERAREGFNGSVLIARDGEVVLQRGFGRASSDPPSSLTPEHQFDIGSMPIDFTRGALLLLAQQNRIDPDHAITEYLDDVPQDKESMTLRHLMTGASGLPNYHHLPEDDDADLTYIDREEAVRRILARPLLFAPGAGEAHSHSAWTLLAAIVEVASGESFEEFLMAHFFGPAGMTRTTWYGPDSRFSVSDQAVGYGQPASDPNIPLEWGRASWLVMGGGGMVSTPGDLYRWHRFVRSDALLTARSRDMLPQQGVFMGDSDRGFLTVVSFTPQDVVIASTNSFRRDGDMAHQTLRGLARLTMR